MAKTLKKKYEARWEGPTLASLASITITAASDAGAMQTARRQAVKIGLPNTLFTLHEGRRLVHHGL